MRRTLAALALPLSLGACTGGGLGGGGASKGLSLPSIGAEVVLKDTTIDVGELQLRLLVTPDQLDKVLKALEKQKASGGPSKG